MGRIFFTIVSSCLVWAGVALADEHPVVIELYTSQGCSSCPPADEFMAKLAARDDVIALALHVDYWDYIGWKDSFGDPAFSARQRSYARAVGSRTVYTPQMIVGGDEHVVGFRPMEVADLIQAHRGASAPVTLDLKRAGGKIWISATAVRPIANGALVQVVRYIPKQSVAIKRGENAGRTVTYYNIVTDWDPVARWDGAQPLSMSVDAGAGPVVAIVQERGPGKILAAARLR